MWLHSRVINKEKETLVWVAGSVSKVLVKHEELNLKPRNHI